MSVSRFLLLSALALSSNAGAATFVVDTTADLSLTACTAAPADCSLRGAITNANAASDTDRIEFDIPASDSGYLSQTAHWRIVATADLPFIAHPLTIDGYTQPGAMANTLAPDQGGSNAALKIEISGANTYNYGFYASALSVHGLALNGFRGGNLLLSAPGPHRVQGCFIGTDVTGTLAPGNSSANTGIRVASGNVVVGGLDPAARNVISGNATQGVWDYSGTTTAPNTYLGNVIGLAADGSTIIASQGYGIFMNDAAQGSLIGGDTVAARNIFGGNQFNAITVTGNPLQTATPLIRITGNYFGTDWSGVDARGNGLNPGSPSQPLPTIQIGRLTHCGVTIGGVAPGQGNLIANGGQAAVAIGSCRGAPVLGNGFWNNRGIAIDLAGSNNHDGPTPNDPNDDDGTEGVDAQWIYRGNRFQNTAQVLEVSRDDAAGAVHVLLRVDSSTSNSAYPLRLEFYTTHELGLQTMQQTASIEASHAQQDLQFTLPLIEFPRIISIVVTDADGNSSEMVRAFVSGDIFSDGFE